MNRSDFSPLKWFLLGLCVLSLAVNAILLRTKEREKMSLALSQAIPLHAEETASPAEVTALSSNVWTQIEEGDPRALAELRRAGFSEALIHAIVRAQVEVQFNEKEHALEPDPRSLKYWRKEIDSLHRPSSHIGALDLRRDKARHLERLLGADENEEAALAADPRTAFLPAEKALRIRKMTEEYEAMSADIRGGNAIALLPSEREKLSYLEKEKRADLEQILSKEELTEYDLRNSRTANVLRSIMSAFQPNEEEFRTIFGIFQKAARFPSDPFEAAVLPTPEQVAARGKIQMEMEAELRATLGEKRYPDFARAKDSEFQTLYEIGTRLGLPAENAVEAYNLNKAFEKRLSEASAAQLTGAPQGRRPTPAAILEEAKIAFTKVLSPSGFEAFRARSSLFRESPLEVIPPSSETKR